MPGIERIAAGATADGDVLAVTSGLTIMCVLSALGLGPLPRFVPNGAVTVLDHGASGWAALTVADMRYAEPSAA